MRAGLTAIQQTLTAEAAAVLAHSIAEAHRRHHGQTTPLHVASTLLSSPSGYLRQACVRSHPNSTHPLQSRALELCFSVALDRLPATSAAADPPISNALMAALKRAQAHQRRGCPEQQQQPLLAVKVELDQLIISILDDPSVSRVMREASFSSPAVKSAIEHSIATSNPLNSHHHRVNFSGIAPRLFAHPPPLHLNRNVYINPRLQPQPAAGESVKKVVEVMLRSNKRNPILVGDSEAEAVVSELLTKIESKEFEIETLRNVEVISMEKGMNRIVSKMEELGGMIEGTKTGFILDLGDLKWAVEQRLLAAEVAKLVARFKGENKLWLIGTASCETYLRCQVYHSAMETDWDLQPLPIASTTFPRLGAEKLPITPMEPFDPRTALLPSFPSRRVSENFGSSDRCSFCPSCSENYDKEVSKLTAIHESFSEATSRASLPQWLQDAKPDANDASLSQELISKQKTQELQNKWRDICLHLHPSFHQNRQALAASSLYNATFHLMLQTPKPSREIVHLNIDEATNSPPQSPVRTDLVLGRKGTNNNTQKVCEDRARDLLSCVSSQPQRSLIDKFSNSLDADTYKKLLKGLMEKAWWQKEAASTVASAITSCRYSSGKRRGSASRGDIWLLFTGPDRVGKKKMASVIAEQICGTSPIMICLGARRDVEDSETNFRGRTAIDRIAEVVRRNPFSMIMLQDIDEGDMLVRGSIKRAIERGRIADSHGREVNLGNCIFVITGDWSEANLERDDRFVDEKKLASIASGNWELGLVVRERSSKRNASWLYDDEANRPSKREAGCGLSLDLNLSAANADAEEERTEGSDHNSSDLTVDHDEEFSHANRRFSVPLDLLENVDETVAFEAVESGYVRREIKKSISLKFLKMVDEENLSLDIEDDVLDKILGGIWHDRTGLQEWIEKVLEPSFDRFKKRLPAGGQNTVRLVVESDSGGRGRSKNHGDWLPSRIFV